MPRVARTITSFYPHVTGPANQAFIISKGLMKSTWTTKIFTTTFKSEHSPREDNLDGVRIERVPIAMKYMQYLYTPDLRNRLSAFEPDLVHAHGYRSYQTEVAFEYARRQRKPFVISMHGMASGYASMVTGVSAKLPYWAYDRGRGLQMLSRSDAIVVNSSLEENEVAAFLKGRSDKIVKIPVGVEDRGRAEVEPDQRDQSLLFVGRITRDRNLPLLLRAFSMLSKTHPRLRLKIVGGEGVRSSRVRAGVMPELKALSSSLGLKNVEFTGELRGEALQEAYRNSDIFVYTSLYENFGQTILDAAAYGLPVISTRVGVVPDLIDDGENGIILKANDSPLELARAVNLLLADVDLRRDFGKKIRAKALGLFSWDKVIPAYAKLYQGLT